MLTDADECVRADVSIYELLEECMLKEVVVASVTEQCALLSFLAVNWFQLFESPRSALDQVCSLYLLAALVQKYKYRHLRRCVPGRVSFCDELQQGNTDNKRKRL